MKLRLSAPGLRRSLLLDDWSLRYGLAVVAVGLAWASREYVLTQAGDRSPFLTFGLAVLITALAAGFGPGLVATVLSSIVAVLLYLPPRLALAVHSPVDVAQLGMFVLEGLIAATAGEAIRRAIAREERLAGLQASYAAYLLNAKRLQGMNPGRAKPPIEPLTEREVEVVRLLSLGLGNREIADSMFVTCNTVKTHLQHVYEKLAVHTRTEAVARCLELGLLEPGPPASGSEPIGDDARPEPGLLLALRRRAG